MKMHSSNIGVETWKLKDFEYDKRENFDPIETCKWDESDDDSF